MEKFDTIVVGYYHDHPFEANVQFGAKFLERCVAHDKNVFLFDQDLKDHLDSITRNTNYRGLVHVPQADRSLFESVMSFKHCPKLKIPVLAVVGTSNRQGKFTSQLRISRILNKAGYSLAHVATEPNGALLGADFTFHYGHKSGTVQIDRANWAEFLRTVVRGIQAYNDSDMILTGTQGSVVPRMAEYNHATTSIDFLFGMQPDAIVCAINPSDSIELIRRNTDAVRSFCGVEALFYTMTPWRRNFERFGEQYAAHHRRLNLEELREKCLEFEQKLGKPVVDVMDVTKDEAILGWIQNEFS